MRRNLKNLFTENLSYKLISLFIALILWITILGRSDSIATRQLEVEVLTSASIVAVSQSVDQVKARVTGPRTALRRFVGNGFSQVVTVNLTDKEPGEYEVDIPRNKLDLPFGVKLLSLQPAKLTVRLESRP